MVTDGDVGQQVVGPRRIGQRAGDLGVDDRTAVACVELGEPLAMKNPVASPSIEKPPSCSSSVSSAALSSRVWNGLIGVSRPGEKVIRFGVDINSTPRRSQDPNAFGDELRLIPQVFDHLEVDHDINVAVGQRQLGQVAVAHLHPRIAGPHVRDGRLVVVEPDHTACHVGDQVGAVALAAARLEHIAPGAAAASRWYTTSWRRNQ